MTLSLRKIDASDYPKLKPPASFGRPARLEWLPVKQLVVDPEYQRGISGVGRKNVIRIASTFNWAMFAPVIVSGVGSNQYAIVDGQHRVTAAALLGIDNVPCCIIEAKRGEQAAAFKAINGNVTRMHTTSMLHASIAAGESDALRLKAVADRAGVVILRYPKPVSAMSPGETIAVSSIRRAIDRFGDDIVALSLEMLATAGGGYSGVPEATIHRGYGRGAARSSRVAKRQEKADVRLLRHRHPLNADGCLRAVSAPTWRIAAQHVRSRADRCARRKLRG